MTTDRQAFAAVQAYQDGEISREQLEEGLSDWSGGVGVGIGGDDNSGPSRLLLATAVVGGLVLR